MYRILKIIFSDNCCNGFRSMAQLCSAGEGIIKGIDHSDFFPFIGDRYYTSKPLCITEALTNLNFQDRKHLRFTRFVDVGLLNEFLNGGYSFADEITIMAGNTQIKADKVIFCLNEDRSSKSGIYCITEDSCLEQIDIKLAERLYSSEAEICLEDVPAVLAERINNADYTMFELLSPFSLMELSEAELERILYGSSYDLVVNGGQICLKAGSCITADAAAEFGINMKLGVIKNGR